MKPADGQAVFSIESVRKSFGAVQVLNGLSLQLNSGDFALLLGANGSGKSTLLRICAGLARPDAGAVTKVAPVLTAYSGHSLHLYSALTLRENLVLTLKLFGLSADPGPALEAWALTNYAERKVGELSRGLQARAALCRAFLHRPRIVLLDEPSSNLDDAAFALLLKNLSMLREQAAVPPIILAATHDLQRFLSAASRILVLLHGKIACDRTMDRKLEALDFYRESNR